MRGILIERTLPFPQELVWAALTDADQLAAWLMPNDFRPVLGHRFTFRTKPAPGFDGIVQSEVLAIEPPRRLVIAWKGGPLDTTVTFDLADVGGQTRLVLRHDGFSGPSNLIPRIVLGFGWKDLMAKKLVAHLVRRATQAGMSALAPGHDPA